MTQLQTVVYFGVYSVFSDEQKVKVLKDKLGECHHRAWLNCHFCLCA